MILYEYPPLVESAAEAPETPSAYTRSCALLAVRGFGSDPGVVTQLLGMVPTSEFRIGEPQSPGSKRGNRQSGWNFESPLPDDASPAEHLEALIPLLEPHAARIVECSSRFSTRINCCILHNHAMPPSLQVSPVLLQRIAALKVPLLFQCTPLPQRLDSAPQHQPNVKSARLASPIGPVSFLHGNQEIRPLLLPSGPPVTNCAAACSGDNFLPL